MAATEAVVSGSPGAVVAASAITVPGSGDTDGNSGLVAAWMDVTSTENSIVGSTGLVDTEIIISRPPGHKSPQPGPGSCCNINPCPCDDYSDGDFYLMICGLESTDSPATSTGTAILGATYPTGPISNPLDPTSWVFNDRWWYWEGLDIPTMINGVLLNFTAWDFISADALTTIYQKDVYYPENTDATLYLSNRVTGGASPSTWRTLPAIITPWVRVTSFNPCWGSEAKTRYFYVDLRLNITLPATQYKIVRDTQILTAYVQVASVPKGTAVQYHTFRLLKQVSDDLHNVPTDPSCEIPELYKIADSFPAVSAFFGEGNFFSGETYYMFDLNIKATTALEARFSKDDALITCI